MIISIYPFIKHLKKCPTIFSFATYCDGIYLSPYRCYLLICISKYFLLYSIIFYMLYVIRYCYIVNCKLQYYYYIVNTACIRFQFYQGKDQQFMSNKYKTASYCDLINYKDLAQCNPQQLWSQPKARKQTAKPKPIFVENKPAPQSKLLQSALIRIRYEHQKFEDDALEDILSQSSSNFMFSRENTPSNVYIPKKKPRQQHRTVASQLFDIESKRSDQKNAKENFYDDLILEPHLIGLTELVYAEVMGKQRKISRNLIHSWKYCLLPQDKQQIYGPNAPDTFSRLFAVNQLNKGFDQIYGSGKKRCLRAGEQALLIHHMDKYLQKCQKQIMKIARKDFDIVSDILKSAKLEELQSMPICMKQIELIWKILATQWRYSGRLDKTNRLLENALFNGKSNFIDLRKQNAVTSFLFLHSNKKEIEDS